MAIRKRLMRQTVKNREKAEKPRSRIVDEHESFYTLLSPGGAGGMILYIYLFLGVGNYVLGFEV